MKEKIVRTALRIRREGLKLKAVRILDRDLLLKEKVKKVDMRTVLKVNDIERKWKILFEKCYGYGYRVSSKERGMLKKICEENLESEITASILAMFWEYVSGDWWKDKVPSLSGFISSFDKWKAKGYAVIKFMDKDRWWLINEGKISANELSNLDLRDVLRIKKDDRGRIVVNEIKEGRVIRRRVYFNSNVR